MAVEYNDIQLQHLFAELEPKNRRKIFRGAFRKAASSVRRAAVANLKRSGLHNAPRMAKGIRASVFRRVAGFKVTVAPDKSRHKGFYKNSRGKEKPVLLWAERGTAERFTRSKSRFFVRSRKGHRSGRMRAFGYMARTLDQVQGKITDELHDDMRTEVVKIARKYGCS